MPPLTAVCGSRSDIYVSQPFIGQWHVADRHNINVCTSINKESVSVPNLLLRRVRMWWHKMTKPKVSFREVIYSRLDDPGGISYGRTNTWIQTILQAWLRRQCLTVTSFEERLSGKQMQQLTYLDIQRTWQWGSSLKAMNGFKPLTLTLSSPIVSDGYTSKCSGPYWPSPSFLIFDIRALWRSVLGAIVPECQKIKKVG